MEREMLSIGDLIDKLVIENIKIFNVRELIHNKKLNDKEYVELNKKMMILNKNRSIISTALDNKIEKVISKEEKNSILEHIKTYK
jgi:hypothetical protein